ncbi:MAG TPA: metallophosphoesterase [Polyangiaceae bacterium]|nr:metallophosphoesterase [Polyangiaceae bacterium]
MSEPLLILSDVHLSRRYGSEVARDLAQLVRQHPDCEILLAGDVLDLTLDPAAVPADASVTSALTPHVTLVEALRDHVRGPGRLTLVPGNHDACLNDPSAVLQLRRLLDAHNDQNVQVLPWFVRRGTVHIEHGHLYDPDCAPNHPLADPNPSHEGLGNALMRRFVAPNGAFCFAHQNQMTMAAGIAKAFAEWGPRAPWVIANYMHTALTLWAEATFKKGTVSRAKRQGEYRLAAYAASQDVLQAALDELLSHVPSPTHHSSRDTFYRLYFDRVFAAFSLVTGAGLLASAGLAAALGALPLVSSAGALSATGALLSSLGAGYLTVSVSKTKNRYGHAVIKQLEHAAGTIARATDAELVVMGHSHVEVEQPHYVNLGSFGFPRQGRPYLLVDSTGRHEKRWQASA